MTALSYTVGNLIDDTIHQLLGSTRLLLNSIASFMNNTDVVSVIPLNYPIAGVSGITPGTYVEVEQEEMYVTAVNAGAQTITVLRGIPTSITATHAANTLMYINSPFPRWSVAKHLRDELRSWGPQVYSIAHTDVTLKQDQTAYDIGALGKINRIIEVTVPSNMGLGQQVVGSSLSFQNWPTVPFTFRQDAPTASFPSGQALLLGTYNFDWSIAPSPLQMHIVYAQPFDVDTEWLESTDCLEDIGLDSSDLDIPPLGVAYRMMSFREIRRTMTELQGEPRDAQEVAALFITRTADAFKALRDSRLNDAALRLLQRYPTQMSW